MDDRYSDGWQDGYQEGLIHSETLISEAYNEGYEVAWREASDELQAASKEIELLDLRILELTHDEAL